MDKLKQWVALTLVACLGIMAAGWFLLVGPKRAEATEVRAQAATQETANATLRTQLQVLQTQAKDLPKKQADLARVAAKIPGDAGMPTLIRALTAAATSAGVQLVSVTPGPPQAAVPAEGAAAAGAPVPAGPDAAAPAAGDAAAPAPGAAASAAGALAVIPLEIDVAGGYFEVAAFLANAENLSRALKVDKLALAPGEGPTAGGASTAAAKDGRSLTTTITGSVFMAANRAAATPVVAPAK